MLTFPEIDYQQQLIVCSLDDFTPNAALPHVGGGQFGICADVWKDAVIDFLCLNVKCGLIEPTHRDDLSLDDGIHGLRTILTRGDDKNQLDADVLWNVLYFNSTSRLDEMLDRSGLRSWEALKFSANEAFIAELKLTYAKS